MPIPEPENDGGGRYFKMSSLKNGPVKITFVSEVISGFHGWPEGSNVPVRSETKDGFPKDIVWRKEKEGFKDGPKQWWAGLIRDWNDGGALKIFMWTQVSITKELKRLERDADWGELPAAGYAIKISRTDDGGKTSYSVTPSPAVKQTAEQVEEVHALLESWTGLSALFTNGDPFAQWSEA